MSVIGGKPKPNRVTVQVVENGKHYAKHTVYTDAATVDRLVRGALHRAATERDERECQCHFARGAGPTPWCPIHGDESSSGRSE